MREIDVSLVTDVIADMCVEACLYISDDMKNALENSYKNETSDLAKKALDILLQNAIIAKTQKIPICQDTGMTVVFIDVGQDVHFVNGDITEAINRGVAKGYSDGYLRKSVVADPINRINTKDNTPAIIHYNIVAGDKVHITLSVKGFGSENKSVLKMLNPADGIEGIKSTVIDCVKIGGSSACPPLVIGVGIGGTIEKCTLIAKTALLREVGSQNKDPYWDHVEQELLQSINDLGIGASGFGGDTTAVAVHINTFASHIAALPVAINICCHANRHVHQVI